MLINSIFLLASLPIASAFSPVVCGNSKLHDCALSSTAASDQEARVQMNIKTPVSRISVCAGELCQCQGEEYEYTGGASDAVIKELQSLNLPFPVDEVGCLGACGLGTMVAIDFENGDSIMTDGLDSTLDELGISVEKTPVKATTTSSTSNNNNNNGGDEMMSLPTEIHAADAGAVVPRNNQRTKRTQDLVDVRDRMRQEAADETERINPWVTMASYLAGKAKDKIFGS